MKNDFSLIDFFKTPYTDESGTKILFRSKIVYSTIIILMFNSLLLLLISILFGGRIEIFESLLSFAVFFLVFLFFRSQKIKLSSVLVSVYMILIPLVALFLGDGLHDIAVVLIPVFLLVVSLLNNSITYGNTFSTGSSSYLIIIDKINKHHNIPAQ